MNKDRKGGKAPSPAPAPPGPAGRRATLRNPKAAGKGGKGKRDPVAETAAHAAEVRALASGHDFVELRPADTEQRPAAFDRKELQVIRSWVQRRPLEPTAPAAAMIDYPRMWTTKRGRYCKFRAPGAGVYALIRARPTF